MQTADIQKILRENPYPGRGILIGMAPGHIRAVIAYFIMGRSENSRNRVFEQLPDGTLRTAAADPGKLSDPSLIIYNALRGAGEHTVVTNGDQTDTVAEALAAGGSFEAALRTRTFEPDAPNYTPRISGLLTTGLAGFSYKLSILKTEGGDPALARRFFFDYPDPAPGLGHFIHTYAADDGQRLHSFHGEPVAVAVGDDPRAFGDELWAALNPDNKVALAVRSVALDGTAETLVYNKYGKID